MFITLPQAFTLLLWSSFIWIASKAYLEYYSNRCRELIPPIRIAQPSVLRSSSAPSESTGSLHCFVGPMFSGKTSTMLSHVVRYADVTNNSPLVINHTIDKDRSVGNGLVGAGISSHSSQFKGLSKRVNNIYTDRLADLDVSQTNVIGIDEAQLYPDLYDTVRRWLAFGKHIYCAGLDGSFKAENFGQIHKLLPISDTFNKILAVCHQCHKNLATSGNVIVPSVFVPAPFTAKIGGNMDLEVEQGGQDKYLPVCRYHFHNL